MIHLQDDNIDIELGVGLGPFIAALNRIYETVDRYLKQATYDGCEKSEEYKMKMDGQVKTV